MQLLSLPVFISVLFSACTVSTVHFSEKKAAVSNAPFTSSQSVRFRELKKRYDTLIPVMNGLFITCDSFDYNSYQQYIAKMLPAIEQPKDSFIQQLHFFSGGFSLTCKKWGIIDSANNIIVPFICDAVRELENGKGIFSIYKHSYSLNTGLPRYNYTGFYYFFDHQGSINTDGKLFEITTIFVADFHKAEFVVEQGNAFYLPHPYAVVSKRARGGVSKGSLKSTDAP